MVNCNKLFKDFPCLHFDHIALRELNSNDYNELYEIYSDHDNANFITDKIHNTIEETIELINRILQEYESGFCIYWVITLKNIDKLIGFVAIHKINYENHTARIGYILNKKYWGKGIANKAIKMITEFVLKETSINMIEATIKTNNISSIKCIENAGYTLKRRILDYVSGSKMDVTKERFLYVKKIEY